MHHLMLIAVLGIAFGAFSQDYPDPEFLDEVCYLKKGDSVEIIRLEKVQSKLDTRVKAAGVAGAETGYMIDGEKSNVRVASGNKLSFVYSSSGAMGSFGMTDISSLIALYKADVAKGTRKVLLQKGGGYFGGKMRSSVKYSFSVRLIHDGYWELVIDKSLPEGEYVFTSVPSGTAGMDGSVTMFAFGVDGEK
jgi:hypothetical protein